MKKIIGKIIFVIAVIGLIFSGYKLYLIWKDYNENQKSYSNLQCFEPKSIEGQDITKYKFSPIDYDKLLNTNSDFVAWINIPGTIINYPMVKPSEESDDYYLTHNFEKLENSGGAIFVEKEIPNPFEAENTIIHGHNMRDGSMFEGLSNYKEQDFFDRNSKIYITTKDTCYTYKIFSVYVDKANDNPYQYSFRSAEEYVQYLNNLKQKSLFLSDIEDFTQDDKIITLSTCSYEFKDARCLVHAKLISKEQN